MSNNASDKKQRPNTAAANGAVIPTPQAAGSGANAISPDGASSPPEQRPNGEAARFVAPAHGGVDILKLLTELEDQIENTPKKMGMMFRFDEDKFHMTVMKIRANLPEEMKRASKLAREQERIVEETKLHSERSHEEARLAAQAEVERGKKAAQAERDAAKAESERQRAEAKAEAMRMTGDASTALDRAREAAEREARQILDEARAHGKQVIAEAQAQAAQLVSDNEIVQQAQIIAQDLQARAQSEAQNGQQRAQTEAQELRAHANAESQAVRRGADEYARDVLVNLENVLGKATAQVQRGRDLLEKPR